MNTNAPFLYYNFIQQNGTHQSIEFTHPIKVYQTYHIDNVLTYLNKIQQDVLNGYYAAGYLSYESAPAFNQNLQTQNTYEMPLLWFGIFSKPKTNLPLIDNNESYTIAEWKPNILITQYYENIDKIKAYINNGHTEQVNYTLHLESMFSGNAFSYYKQLERAQNANYNAFLNIGDYSILSASPELFFQIKNGVITTKPMKGTIDRGYTYNEDIQKAKWLKTSKKNRYENKLITELMSSELKKISQPDTVKIKNKYEVEKYPTVHQMTSTVQAKLEANTNIIDIFKTLFPCGSITGTPKRKTMKIIDQLEASPREVYCGAIGYIAPNQDAVFNVPIRTVVINNRNGRTQYGVGGAITTHSNKIEEFQEILTKAKVLTDTRPAFKLLETFGLHDGKYIVFDYHMKRLKQSAQYFDFDINIALITNKLECIALKHNKKRWKVRLLVEKDGKYSIEREEISPNPDHITVALSSKPISKDNIFLYHKTNYRDIYKEHLISDENIYDVLLWNEDKEVTEFTMGNIVVELEGMLYTPPVTCGLLPGTFRKMLLQKKMIQKKVITIDQLQKCTNIWFINSVRKWIPVTLIQ